MAALQSHGIATIDLLVVSSAFGRRDPAAQLEDADRNIDIGEPGHGIRRRLERDVTDILAIRRRAEKPNCRTGRHSTDPLS
jgi:hypothetical protein